MDYPGEKLLIRLWETLTEKGVGSLLRPWQIRREGRAQIDVHAQELVVLAQAEKYAEDIREGRKFLRDGALVALPPQELNEQGVLLDGHVECPRDVKSLVQEVTNITLANSIRREVNLSRALLHAEATLEQDQQEPPEKQVDNDWLYRWRECASSVSTAELQSIWGSLLAGEIKSPGSFSFRTLDFLRNLSHSEAESIAKLSRFAIENMIVRYDKDLLDREGITLAFLMEMQHLGVVSGVEGFGLTVTLDSLSQEKFVQSLKSHGKVVISTHADATKKLTLPVCLVSSLGRQVLGLGKFEAHDEYLRKVGEAIKTQGFEVKLAHYTRVSDDQIRWFNAEDL